MSTSQHLILGAGGHAKVVAAVLCEAGCRILGCIDPALEQGADWIGGLKCLGDDSALNGFDPDQVLLANGIGSLPGQNNRTIIFERLKALGFTFATLVHPHAWVADDVDLGEGAQVMAGVIIQPGTQIGRNAILNTRCSVDHDCVVGDHTHIAPGAVLSGDVFISNGCHVGTGATIIQGITVGSSAVVGAGAIITRPVPEEATVYPARSVMRGCSDE